ncbi:hypothetical protein GY50_0225 [Dehalococcoides mccartyi GY50]|nr:hypothetical protein GY50_0225 [Dehalococcoides mccartyi GY50]
MPAAPPPIIKVVVWGIFKEASLIFVIRGSSGLAYYTPKAGLNFWRSE